jgi:hypothetical protein
LFVPRGPDPPSRFLISVALAWLVIEPDTTLTDCAGGAEPSPRRARRLACTGSIAPQGEVDVSPPFESGRARCKVGMLAPRRRWGRCGMVPEGGHGPSLLAERGERRGPGVGGPQDGDRDLAAEAGVQPAVDPFLGAVAEDLSEDIAGRRPPGGLRRSDSAPRLGPRRRRRRGTAFDPPSLVRASRPDRPGVNRIFHSNDLASGWNSSEQPLCL